MKFIPLLLFCLLLNPQLQAQRDIFAAARTGDTVLASTLISRSPDLVNCSNDQGYTPVILAAYYGREDFIKFLIKHNLKLQENNGESTALQAAAYKGYSGVVAVLLEFGAIPDIADANGTTPLIYAAQAGHTDIVKLLLRYGADKEFKDPQGYTAFDYAEKFQQKEIAGILK